MSSYAQAAKELAAPFDVVRVDLYSVGGEIFFSEFTFSPHAAVKKVENDAEVLRLVQRVMAIKASQTLPCCDVDLQATPAIA